MGGDARLAPALVIAAAVLTALACAALPDVRAPRASGSFSGVGALLRDPAFAALLAVAGLIQCSHAAYYGFATLHWRAAGVAPAVIGALWAEAVAAEVVLFAFSRRLLRRFAVAPLLAAAAGAGALRWLVIGATADVAALAAAQALHAASFGAAHLAAMRFIQRAVPPERSATAQGLYSAVAMGAGMALATMAAGALYESAPARAFQAMAAIVRPRRRRRARANPGFSQFVGASGSRLRYSVLCK